MTFWTLIRRSLRFHWHAHLGVVLGAAAGSAALIGALVVGDSVRESLRERALERVENIWAAMDTHDSFFTTNLLPRMNKAIANGYKATVEFSTGTGFYPGFNGSLPMACVALHLPASVDRQDGSRRANAASVFGCDSNFLAMIFPRKEF